jgi:hypothetical protein
VGAATVGATATSLLLNQATGGGVSIGKSTASATLDVSGNVAIGGTFEFAVPLYVQAIAGATTPSTNGIFVANSVTGASNTAIMGMRTANGGGNAFMSYDIAGVQGWSVGVDQGDLNNFKIGADFNGPETNTKMTITTDGNVGIGISNPTTVLQVGGDVVPSADNAYTCGNSDFRWAEIWAVNGTIQTSDQRKKTDISDTQLGLDFITALRPVDYKWIEGQKQDIRDGSGNILRYDIVPGIRIHHGFLSQEVKTALDNHGIDSGIWILTDLSNNSSDQGVRYTELIAPMVKAIKELSIIKGEQAGRIATLEAQNATLQTQINAIKAHIGMS